VIVAGASPGETKMWAAMRENGDFIFAIAFRITGKLLKIDGYMQRDNFGVERGIMGHGAKRDLSKTGTGIWAVLVRLGASLLKSVSGNALLHLVNIGV